MVSEFPEGDCALFDRTLAFLRAACVTVGGRGSTKDLSCMASGWHPPSYQSGRFRLWKTQTMRSIYPKAFESVGPTAFTPPAGLPPLPTLAPAPAPTFAEIMTGATGLVDHMASRMKETVSSSVTSKNDFKWSQLTREAIIRAHGLPESTAWTSTEIAGIWYAYQEEMKNLSNKETAVQRVFHATAEANPSLDTGETLQPRLSSSAACHIRTGVLVSYPISYDNCDEIRQTRRRPSNESFMQRQKPTLAWILARPFSQDYQAQLLVISVLGYWHLIPSPMTTVTKFVKQGDDRPTSLSCNGRSQP